MARYDFASTWATDNVVLDFGCGEGYGSELISKVTNLLFALEIDPVAAQVTSSRIGKTVVVADARSAPFQSEFFDVIISFEVFEHITNVEHYVSEAYRMLKKDGLFIMSTPNVETYPMAGMNPYHVKEYTVGEVKKLTAQTGFSDPDVYAQIANNEGIERLEKSKLLLSVMKLKRRLGFHGDLLPKPIQRIIHRRISKSDPDHFNKDDYCFIKGKVEEPELIYILRK
ncbi:MAG: class I SAM-dependent methyltransferase [Calditrichaeota bacterium]|nr:class I SAM-dependent methyltransferase [Calditrichota bacterium]